MKRTVEVSPWLYIMMAAGILLLPVKILAAAALAAGIHEISHLLVLKLFKIPVYQIRIGAGGARICAGTMTALQEILCAAAGPVGSFALLLLLRLAPELALFGMVQGLFNLLPVYPLDGGRILRGVLRACLPGSGYR